MLPQTGIYKMSLVSVDAKGTNIGIAPDDENKYANIYEDNIIKIDLSNGSKAIYLAIENKTDEILKIIWDEVVLIDTLGQSSGVIHEGVKYIDKDKSQVPTVILKRAKITESIIPAKNISFSNYDKSSAWEISNIVSGMPKGNIGKELTLYLPIWKAGSILEYYFYFKITDFEAGNMIYESIDGKQTKKHSKYGNATPY